MYKPLQLPQATCDKSWITVAGCCGIHGPCMPSQMALPFICIPNMEFTLQLTHLQPATYPITGCPPSRHCLLCLHSFLPAAQLISHRVVCRGARRLLGCSWTHDCTHWQHVHGPTCQHAFFKQTAQTWTHAPASAAQSLFKPVVGAWMQDQRNTSRL